MIFLGWLWLFATRSEVVFCNFVFIAKLSVCKLFQSHNIKRVASKFQNLAPLPDFSLLSIGIESVTLVNGTLSSDEDEENSLEDNEKEVKMSLDELISGALESAFWAMDKLILKDKEAGFRIRYIDFLPQLSERFQVLT